MSQRPKVDRELVFQADAATNRNVEGNFNPKKVYRSYEFTELLMNGTNNYTMSLDTTSTIAAGAYGAVMTTAATDTKNAELTCGGIWWYPGKNAICEIKWSLDVVTTVAINIGFNDAVYEGSGVLPFLMTGTTLADTATNGAMFMFDSLQGTDYFYIVNTNAATEASTILASGYGPTADRSYTMRVALDTAGNARYYIDGVQVGYKALAVSIATAIPFIPYIGIRNNSGTAHIATVRYVRCWQDM